MSRYVLEFFVQGRGWVGQVELGLSGGLETQEEAENIAAHLIDSRMKKASHPYGSRIGDVVGFRIVEKETPERMRPSPDALRFRFSEVKHRFYKRGEAYMLYKYWSWPD
ncbi:MAG: hypothetical protein RMJ28_04840 [Nitrososphaerota archaeon]|nr:hypothetical protein [Candidatus Calditenuaceae archaeon]MDW8073546.1 hypothetical protein [Nitrososphaerota archaeon]